MATIDHALIIYSDGSARVRTFAQCIQVDDYIVHDEDGDPVTELPDGISITKRSE